MRVGIIGAGIGGLTLAHALSSQHIEVVLFDRDPASSCTGGYRLHLSEEALKSLHLALPAETEHALRKSGTGKETFKQFSILDHQGQTKLRIRQPDHSDPLMIGRLPLRTILASQLEHQIRWDTHFTCYEEADTGIRLHFANAESELVDVLVGADGVNSAVARQLLNRKTAKSAGVTAIAGKTRLTNHFRSSLYKDLFIGPGFAAGPQGIGMFLSVHDPVYDGPQEFVNSLIVHEEPYLIWSVAALDETFYTDLKELTSGELQLESLRLLHDWDQGYQELVNHSVEGETAAFKFWFPSNLSAWKHNRITLIGDAVHPMPPTGGLGASTAIIDAVHLAKMLNEQKDIPTALHMYQKAMLKYAPKAIDEARPPLFWQRRFTNEWIRKFAMSILLPAVDQALSINDRFRKNK
ncbi:hypothetical protein BK126_17825 [Paenibacillus sp. FSL H7-0326]|uniref:FAD-dependent oxidoreductase n=1 Tax=Paenibacillus sp. FSL H7-0326 TaxID=1921144 RepID=UPI00096BD8FF|nr:NAD(P)/FAD-dependent oxidoreductase [Paenibacillus sp. FSL H7-0326]OMC67447.1 hypothetical protein BK126_17825 [Paenibacillus sp. FSL H7-0326]